MCFGSIYLLHEHYQRLNPNNTFQLSTTTTQAGLPIKTRYSNRKAYIYIYTYTWRSEHSCNYCFEESPKGFPLNKSATMFTKALLPPFWGTFPKERARWSFPWQGFCLASLGFSLISTTTCLSFSILYCGVLNIGDWCAAISVMFHLYSNKFQLVALKLWLHDFRIFFFDYFLSLCNKNYYSFF